jgi:hypothetical protein
MLELFGLWEELGILPLVHVPMMHEFSAIELSESIGRLPYYKVTLFNL